jgi:hypothetical protein
MSKNQILFTQPYHNPTFGGEALSWSFAFFSPSVVPNPIINVLDQSPYLGYLREKEDLSGEP